ncbi:MAG: hypothetical protein HYT62_05315 [Candidatus Yanofskybacteria bacterium]|nr:hypothetical protein [Candidatus Yanofskybacteria bacterium]
MKNRLESLPSLKSQDIPPSITDKKIGKNEWRKDVSTTLSALVDRIGSNNPVDIVYDKDGSLSIYEIIGGQRAKNPVFFSNAKEADAFLELIKRDCIEKGKELHLTQE